jgi:hypothetical protein
MHQCVFFFCRTLPDLKPGRPEEAQKMIDAVLHTLSLGKVQQAVVFIRLLARTRFERAAYGEAEAYLARADAMLQGGDIKDPKEKATLLAYLKCDRLAILREQNKTAEAELLEAELTSTVQDKHLPVPLAQSKYGALVNTICCNNLRAFRHAGTFACATRSCLAAPVHTGLTSSFGQWYPTPRMASCTSRPETTLSSRTARVSFGYFTL